MNKITWTKKALKQLKRINRAHHATIINGVEALQNWPNCSNVKSLTNHAYPYRLRIGGYRVMFTVECNEVVLVVIEEVKKRDNKTY